MDALQLPADIKTHLDNWMAWDQNPKTRDEMSSLVAAGNKDELVKRLKTRIAFGTAGLRGCMEAGFAGMNDLTVRQASQGLVTYLLSVHPDATERGIIVGFDGRHNSSRFAELTAATFMSKGVPVYLFDTVIPTPLVAFGTTDLNCRTGIVITASHNPKEDNGYKVYWDNGCQIVAPVDSGVTKCILENLVPWEIDVSSEAVHKHALLKRPTNVVEHYIKHIQKVCFHRDTNALDSVKITYTAMHGVGRFCASEAFKAFGLVPFIPVPEQVDPNPDFPTVKFPNPEEGKGALALSIRTAEEHGSTVIIANDPDADRLAAAERRKDGSWHIFTGNELGIILGYWNYEQYIANNQTADKSKLMVLNTTVSSKFLAAFAAAEGLYYEETLTGFKWIGTAIERLQKQGYTFIMAFEEAIGYMVTSTPLDKDGVSAAAVFSEMSHYLYHKGLTILDYLESIKKKYGYFVTNNKYFFCYDPNIQKAIFEELRNGGKYHEACGPYKIKNIRDLTTPGYDTTKEDKKPIFPTSSSPMITYYFENGAVVTLRGSGTEPKLKYYCEMSGSDPVATEKELNDLVENIITHFLQPNKYEIFRPTD